MEGIKTVETEQYGRTFVVDGSYMFTFEKHTSPDEVTFITGRFDQLEDKLQKHLMGEVTLEYDRAKNSRIIQDFISLLKKDKGLYDGWRANIAMSFYDNAELYQGTYDLHHIANKAADDFLKLLIA